VLLGYDLLKLYLCYRFQYFMSFSTFSAPRRGFIRNKMRLFSYNPLKSSCLLFNLCEQGGWKVLKTVPCPRIKDQDCRCKAWIDFVISVTRFFLKFGLTIIRLLVTNIISYFVTKNVWILKIFSPNYLI